MLRGIKCLDAWNGYIYWEFYYLRVVKLQGSIWFAGAVIKWVHWDSEVNMRSLCWTEHKSNNPTAKIKWNDTESCSCYVINHQIHEIMLLNMPRVCWNASPCIVNRTLEDVTTVGNNVFDDVHVKPQAFSLRAHNSTRTKSSRHGLEEGFLKQLLRRTWHTHQLEVKFVQHNLITIWW